MTGSQEMPKVSASRRPGSGPAARRSPARLLAAMLLGASLLSPQAFASKHPKPPAQKPDKGPLRIPLEQIGAGPVAHGLLLAGESLLTLNILDDSHLLVTFSTHGLIRRSAAEPVSTDARNVQAEIVSLPGGTVEAQTTWRLPDHLRYLWPIGHGRFVLRVGSSLSVLDPLGNLASKDPFFRTTLPHQEGAPLAVESTADGGVITVISEIPPVQQAGPVVVLGDSGQDNAPKPTYAMEYYRVSGEGTPASPLRFRPDSILHGAQPLSMPLDAEGYLWADEDTPGRWTVTFNEFNGKVLSAGQLDSSCPPRLRMVSHSEYVALTCRGTEDAPKLLSMGLDGHETWEEPFSAFVETPAFAFATAAGRFAITRMATETVGGSATTPGTPETNQEVRVYQTESGDLLLRVPLHPVFRVPENFDLSADGRTLAVIADDEIDVYTLPAPSKRDLEDLDFVAKFAPPPTEYPVRLAKLIGTPATSGPAAGAEATTAVEAATAPAASQTGLATPVSTTTQARLTTAAAAEPDSAATGRKRPTLLNPGEVPEFHDKNAAPQ